MNRSLSAHQPKIFIAGDSWGCGEYNKVDRHVVGVSHRGIEQYFLDDGYTVKNSSVGGMSNQSATQRLSVDLLNLYCNNDIILWIQTEPVRDLVVYDNKDKAIYPLTDPIKSAGGLVKLFRQLAINSYNELNVLAKQYNTVVYLLGGCSSLFVEELANYTNLTPLIPSCVELITKEHPNFQFIGLWGINSIHLSTYSQEFAGQVINEFESIVQMEKVFKQPGFFNRHPDRNGYKIVYDYIKQQLNL